jgi:HEAT repeat protein
MHMQRQLSINDAKMNQRTYSMSSHKRIANCIAFFALLVATPAFAQDAAKNKEKEQALIKTLQSDAPPGERAIACKQLAIYGTKDAVPALAALLTDRDLASWARIALEAIPDPAADEALTKALESLEGRLLVGTINSIGYRRYEAAVDALTKRMKDRDEQVAESAAVALGKIGNAPATKTLRDYLSSAPDEVRSAVAEGCILCAEHRLKGGASAEAAAIYDQVRKADVPKQRILEATRGAILARGAQGIPLLVETLHTPDTGTFQIGLSTARELADPAVSSALAGELTKLAPSRAALLLTAIADRNDKSATPAVLEAVRKGPAEVQLAAIAVLGRLGDASSVPTLLEIAADANADRSKAALAALTGMKGKDVDAQIARRVAEAKDHTLRPLIELVGQRRIEATPALLKALEHSDAKVRTAALTALGETVALKDLSALIVAVIDPKSEDDAKVAAAALRAACIRMPDREACAQQLAGALVRANPTTQSTILEILGAMSGPKALDTIATAVKSGNPQLQDAATRVLGETMSLDAAPVLLDLAKTASEDKYKVRAVRGYIRIARQFVMPEPQRAKMCAQALEVAARPEEQKLILAVLERYPHIETLKVAVKLTQNPDLKDDARRVSMVIAQKLGGNSQAAKDLLAQIGQTPVKVEIVKATYGADAASRDVTETLRKHAGDLPLIALPSANYNACFGGDPAPGVVKQLKVKYRINGKEGEATFAENAVILLPMPK